MKAQISETSLEPRSAETAGKTVFPILFALSFSHLLNDTIQSLIPAVYPLIKDSFHLNFTQIGLITLTFQLSASLLQPLVGLYTDRKPQPYSLAIGMTFTLTGLILLSLASSFGMMLVSVGLVGAGSAVFHPEASRMAHLAAGEKRGLAQSIFQLGGNAGSAIGPLLAALILIPPAGKSNIIWFSIAALLAIMVLRHVGKWYKTQGIQTAKKVSPALPKASLPRKTVTFAILILLVLIFSKYFYMAGMTSYFAFYLMHKFDLSVSDSQLLLFVFLFSVAAGTLLGGPLGDRFGRKYVIWGSILGAAPFTLLLPHANLFWTGILIVPIGVILSSAFSAILVYAQELVPGKVGLVSGLFFGFAFGMGGIGAAVLGSLSDLKGIEYVYSLCAFLPLIGLMTWFLPDIERASRKKS